MCLCLLKAFKLFPQLRRQLRWGRYRRGRWCRSTHRWICQTHGHERQTVVKLGSLSPITYHHHCVLVQNRLCYLCFLDILNGLIFGPTLFPVYALQECFLTVPLTISNAIIEDVNSAISRLKVQLDQASLFEESQSEPA